MPQLLGTSLDDLTEAELQRLVGQQEADDLEVKSSTYGRTDSQRIEPLIVRTHCDTSADAPHAVLSNDDLRYVVRVAELHADGALAVSINVGWQQQRMEDYDDESALVPDLVMPFYLLGGLLLAGRWAERTGSAGQANVTAFLETVVPATLVHNRQNFLQVPSRAPAPNATERAASFPNLTEATCDFLDRRLVALDACGPVRVAVEARSCDDRRPRVPPVKLA